MRLRRLSVTAGALVLAAALAACGEDETSEDPAAGMDPSMSDSGMADMPMMNDPDATPADQVDGEVRSGEFVVLDTAPPGSDDVTGEAWLAQGDAGTTVTIRLTGLEPGTTYTGHLHAAACEEDNGGDHFRFDPDGSELPPNEVHLGFTADDAGAGEATITNDAQVGDGAPSVVVHPQDAMDNRLACADLS